MECDYPVAEGPPDTVKEDIKFSRNVEGESDLAESLPGASGNIPAILHFIEVDA